MDRLGIHILRKYRSIHRQTKTHGYKYTIQTDTNLFIQITIYVQGSTADNDDLKSVLKEKCSDFFEKDPIDSNFSCRFLHLT